MFYNLLYVYKVRNKKFDKDIAIEEIKDVALRLNLFGVLDRKVKKLNLFEKRLVCIARAILKKSNIWLMDEPLSGLTNFEITSLWQTATLEVDKLSGDLILSEKGENMAYFNDCEILKLSFGSKID